MLAAIGLYGVLSFSVARRTREIGVRLAVGASRARIVGIFLQESAWMIGAGIAMGLPLALACGKLASSLLYNLTGQDPGTAMTAVAALAVVAFAATVIPAWRAARVDATVALRHE
jgi:ABC-type antimicrobial peptide transport system permease subunit